MSTTPTNQPVPSEKPQDLKFNAGKIDEFVTSMAKQYIDRFGGAHYTIEGLRWMAQQAIAAFGYITLDSFEDGNTLTLPNQVLRLGATGEYYRWDGELPKVVSAGSTPDSTGGVGPGAWVSVGDASLRENLAASDGLKLIGDVPSVLKLNDVSGIVGDKVFLKSYVENENNGGGFLVAVDNSTPVDNIVIFNGNGVKWKRLFFNGEVDIYDAGYTGSGDASSFINSINNHGYDCIVSGKCEFTGVINIDVSKGALKGINKCKLI